MPAFSFLVHILFTIVQICPENFILIGPKTDSIQMFEIFKFKHLALIY